MDNKSSLIIYTTDDGLTNIDVTFDNETVWLSLDQMAVLFDRNKSTISRHIKNIFEEQELEEKSTVAKFATVQTEGNREVERDIEYFNLDKEVKKEIKEFIGKGIKIAKQDMVDFKQESQK